MTERRNEQSIFNDILKENPPTGLIELTPDKDDVVFIGNHFEHLHALEIAELKYTKLYAPNMPQYYTINTRPIVGVDELLEICIDFITDTPVEIEYHDMILNDVRQISIMPEIDGEAGHIIFEDSNGLQLSIIVPEHDMYCLCMSDIAMENDIMLFVNLEMIYHNMPDMKYPHVWIEETKDDTGMRFYQIKARLNPLMIKPIILYEVKVGDPNAKNIIKYAELFEGNVELSYLPYSSIMMDDNHNIYTKISTSDYYLETQMDGNNYGIPYNEYEVIESDPNPYLFKYYIYHTGLVILVDKEGSVDMRIINGAFEDEEKNLEILGELYSRYSHISSNNLEDAFNAINEFLAEVDIKGCVIIDLKDNNMYLLESGAEYQVKMKI